MRTEHSDRTLDIAVVGSGIAGMSAAWLLSRRHRVTVYEQARRAGGHSNTVDAPATGGPVPVDTGFIVYNEANYPNLTALFAHLGVETAPSDMSFGVSLDDGALEYAGNSPGQLFAQKRNLFSPRFWSMLADIRRFYRDAPSFADDGGAIMSLGDYLDRGRYGRPFQDDHLLPMAAAIWSTPCGAVRDYPAAAFIRFCVNHGLLRITARPLWRTVAGGSRAYVSRLTAPFARNIRLNQRVRRIEFREAGVALRLGDGSSAAFDHAVLACHADQALAVLAQPTEEQARLLGAFRYARNRAILHSDPALMPRRRTVWSSWNYLARRKEGLETELCVTYWMNRLQSIPMETPLFVTLNPIQPPRSALMIHDETYEHPLFDVAAIRAQDELWKLQGQRNVWFCGAYFGAGFHEDGLQAGLAVAEALGGVRRPWRVPDESGRIRLPPGAPTAARPAA
jgi:predicted NAD/FAD-binding protein